MTDKERIANLEKELAEIKAMLNGSRVSRKPKTLTASQIAKKEHVHRNTVYYGTGKWAELRELAQTVNGKRVWHEADYLAWQVEQQPERKTNKLTDKAARAVANARPARRSQIQLQG